MKSKNLSLKHFRNLVYPINTKFPFLKDGFSQNVKNSKKIRKIDFLKIDFFHEFIFLIYLYRLKIVDLVGFKVLKNCFEHLKVDFGRG